MTQTGEHQDTLYATDKISSCATNIQITANWSHSFNWMPHSKGPATEVATEKGAKGEWCEGSGWRCKSCRVIFHDKQNGRQKRKSESHCLCVCPCVHQPPMASVTRSMQAALDVQDPPAPRPPPVTPIGRESASLQTPSASNWFNSLYTEKVQETWPRNLGARQSWVFVCRGAFDPASALK